MDDNVRLFMKELRKVPGFSRVKFVILYGSHVLDKSNKMSDYDFAVYYEGSQSERFKFRIRASSKDLFDVHVFQDLPLYIQKEVLRGKVIYVKDFGFLHDIAYETIKKFEDFKKYYYDYIGLEEIK